MTSLVLMYVYFDVNGDIKAITPSLDEGLARTCRVSTFPLDQVEPFLKGQKNTFDYKVKSVEKDDSISYMLTQKIQVTYARSLDNYLTQISTELENPIISLTHYISEKLFILRISKAFKRMEGEGTPMQQEDVEDFLRKGQTTIYITRKNNPYEMFYSISFLPKVLFENGEISYTYRGEFYNTSAYTKKIVNGYRYTEKD